MNTASRPPVEEDDTVPSASEEGATVQAVPRKPLPAWVQKPLDRLRAAWQKTVAYLLSREPRLWPTLTTVMAVAILMSLGTWQLIRMSWKNDMIRRIETQLAAPPADLRRVAPPTEESWKSYDYRPVVVKGTWLPLYAFKIAPRTYEGQVGYHLVLPLKLQNNQILFVNRGFVPDNAKILPPEEEKVFAVQGVLRIPESRKTWAIPENVPSKGQWTWIDLAAMRHEIGVNSAAPVVLYEARQESQDSYPIGGQLPVPIYNRHRQYALIWFALATAFMGIWMIASNPKEKIKPKDENAAANDDVQDPVARRGLYPEATD